MFFYNNMQKFRGQFASPLQSYSLGFSSQCILWLQPLLRHVIQSSFPNFSGVVYIQLVWVMRMHNLARIGSLKRSFLR